MENTHVNESILSAEILEDQKKNRIDHMKYLKGMEDIGSEVLDKVVSEMEAYDYDKRKGGWKGIHYLFDRGITSELFEGVKYYGKYKCGHEYFDIQLLKKW